MNRCSYCGKTYPDEVAICPVDGQSLGGPVAARKKITGMWRGCYGYGPRADRPGFGPVAFTLKLKQGWTSHFTGLVTEDAPAGMPGTGVVDGYFDYPGFEFTKQMPVGYVLEEDGSRKTLRESLAERGMNFQQELSGPPIFYQGRFLDANRVQGTWIILRQPIRLPNGKSFTPSGGAGYWCAEFATDKLDANPGGGPKAELFDKSRLTAKELADVEPPPPPCCLGEFPAAEAQHWVERLLAADISVSFDAAQPDPEEGVKAAGLQRIYVGVEDEAAARRILTNQSADSDEELGENEN
jgi:hypothetical protein